MRPTTLYIKRHKSSGLLYFGKTVKADVHLYDGSGLYWRRHLKKYGRDIETLWYCLYTEEETLREAASSMSMIMDIVNSKQWANIKEENGMDGAVEGYAVYKDLCGDVIGMLRTDHPKVLSGEYVGNLSGHKMTEESKEKMSGERFVTLYYKGFGDKPKQLRVRDFDHEKQLEDHILNGWSLDFCQEYLDILETARIKAEANRVSAVKEAMTDTCAYYYPNSGILYGRIPRDSPIIKELGLVHIRSEKQINQAAEQAKRNASNPEIQAKKSASVSKLKWCYDPETKINTRLETVPEGWILGKYGDSTIGGSTTWNDGVRNYRVKRGDEPEPHWVKGMMPRS